MLENPPKTEKTTEEQLVEGLKEYARPEDLNPRENKPIYGIKDQGRRTVSFSRTLSFEPKSRVGMAISRFENGDIQAIQKLTAELLKIGIELRLRTKDIDPNNGICMVAEIIVTHNGQISGIYEAS